MMENRSFGKDFNYFSILEFLNLEFSLRCAFSKERNQTKIDWNSNTLFKIKSDFNCSPMMLVDAQCFGIIFEGKENLKI